MRILIIFRFLSTFNIAGISLFPFVLIGNKHLKYNKIFMNHERIHLRQQLELLILPFYLWYLFEYVFLRLKMNHKNAYRNIVFEREAYAHEKDLDYLETRSNWQFVEHYRKLR